MFVAAFLPYPQFVLAPLLTFELGSFPRLPTSLNIIVQTSYLCQLLWMALSLLGAHLFLFSSNTNFSRSQGSLFTRLP